MGRLSVFASELGPDRGPAAASAVTLTQMRLELKQWFQKNAPSLAPTYVGAVKLILDPTFSGRIHFIAHAVRDIADRLVFVLDDRLESGRVQYENCLDVIAKDWPRLDSHFSAVGTPGAPAEIALPTKLVQHLDQL